MVNHGTVLEAVTPPLDAAAEIRINGDRFTNLAVAEGETLRIHAREMEEPPGDPPRDQLNEPPESAGDPQAEVTINDDCWVIVSVDGTRRAAIRGLPNDRITIHLGRT